MVFQYLLASAVAFILTSITYSGVSKRDKRGNRIQPSTESDVKLGSDDDSYKDAVKAETNQVIKGKNSDQSLVNFSLVQHTAKLGTNGTINLTQQSTEQLLPRKTAENKVVVHSQKESQDLKDNIIF